MIVLKWLMDVLFSPLGLKILKWVAGSGGTLLSVYVFSRVNRPWLRGILARLWDEAKLTAEDIYSAYMVSYSRAKADGVVTPEEEQEARQEAVNAARMHFTKLGLAHLTRIVLGVSLDNWVQGKVTEHLDRAKKAGDAAVEADPGKGAEEVIGKIKDIE